MSERITIDALGHRGDGVAHLPGGELFVAGALPGEIVAVERGETGNRATLREVVTPSALRVVPPCPHAGVCGGCATQHLRADAYRAWKRDLVIAALTSIDIAAPVDDLIGAHGAGRRRATFHARRGTQDVLTVGFAAARAHQIVPIDRCLLLDPALGGALPAAWSIAEALSSSRKPLDIQATATEGGLDIDVRGLGALPERLRPALIAVAERHDLARLTLHGELIALRRPPVLTIGRGRVELPPGTFLQATVAGEAALASLVAEMVGGVKSVADLFCGVGTFALRLAERARVIAVDGDAPAIAALTKATRGAQGLKPIQAEARDLFRRPLIERELDGVDAVVFDPPRQGAEAQARRLAQSKVKTIVAVSCNPTTFARDAAILASGGWRIERVVPVDQFLHSAHVELVARLVR